MRENEKKSRPRARSLRRELTKAEALLWLRLKNRQVGGWRFRRQHPIGPYIADFACLEAMLIVEVDGATHSTVAETSHDERRTAFLGGLGWRIVRFGNLDIYKALEGVVAGIEAALPPSGPSDHLPRERGRNV